MSKQWKSKKQKVRRTIKVSRKPLTLLEVMHIISNNKARNVDSRLLQKTSPKNPYILQDEKGSFFL